MRADRIPRTIEDLINNFEGRLKRLETALGRERPAAAEDTTPMQVMYDDLPREERDNDLAGIPLRVPMQTSPRSASAEYPPGVRVVVYNELTILSAQIILDAEPETVAGDLQLFTLAESHRPPARVIGPAVARDGFACAVARSSGEVLLTNITESVAAGDQCGFTLSWLRA